MPKLMLINVTHAEESRVGIISNGTLESFEIESLSREHLKGNIYKGVVHRIHPALEAAFVDIGAERDAFLPLDEICFRNLPAVPPQPVDEHGKKQRRRIRDLLKPGEEILVQIAKEQFANKPPTLTTFYSLPGRYLVLLPGSDETGISRRIEGEERQRLRKLVDELNPPDGYGLIVRTAAGLDEDTTELSRDLTYLLRLWESVQESARHRRGPALVYREQDIVLRTIRDLFTPDIDEIHIDNEDVFLRARDFLRNVLPGKEHVLHCYRGEQPIFSAFDVESQIETVFKRRVPLRSGGTIVIDGTEALTAIDVNSGGSVRGPNPEETAFRTNVEAAHEVARQLRLRDIGGLIVVDFIDMREHKHVQEVEQALRTAMKPDKARYELGRISRLGLLEISRQRLRPAAMATTYTTCPMCEGHGAVRTTESAALVALRKIHNRVALGDVATLRAAAPPAVALYLLNHKRDELARLEQRYASRLQIEPSERLMPHQVEIEVRERVGTAARAPVVAPGTVAAADDPTARAATNGAAPAANGSGKKKRRRRGRKRGGALRAAEAIGIALATLGGNQPAPYQPMNGAAALADVADADLDADELSDAEIEAADTPSAESDVDLAAAAPAAAEHNAAAVVTDTAAEPAADAAVATPGAPAQAEPSTGASRRSRGRRGGRTRRGGRPAAAETTAGSTPPPAPDVAAADTTPPHTAEPAIAPASPAAPEPAPAPRATEPPAAEPAAAAPERDEAAPAALPADEPAAPPAPARPRRTRTRATPATPRAPRKKAAAATTDPAAAKPKTRRTTTTPRKRTTAAKPAAAGESAPRPRRARKS